MKHDIEIEKEKCILPKIKDQLEMNTNPLIWASESSLSLRFPYYYEGGNPKTPSYMLLNQRSNTIPRPSLNYHIQQSDRKQSYPQYVSCQQYVNGANIVNMFPAQQYYMSNGMYQNQIYYNYCPPYQENITEISEMVISPSRKNRRGNNNIFTNGQKVHIPILKKDKNIRFSVKLRNDPQSVFSKCRNVLFVDRENSISTSGVLFLKRMGMDYRPFSDHNDEWISIDNDKWVVTLVSIPKLERWYTGECSLIFELRFPNSQRKMNIKTNKNVYRFHLTLNAFVGNTSKVRASSLFFIYQIDSNGKKDKEVVRNLRTFMDKNSALKVEIEQRNGTKELLSHSPLSHSYFSSSYEV